MERLWFSRRYLTYIDRSVYQKEAEADIAGDTSGDLKRFLIGCLQATRPESPEFDRAKARQDAQGESPAMFGVHISTWTALNLMIFIHIKQ